MQGNGSKRRDSSNSLNRRLTLVLALVSFSLLGSVANNFYWGVRLAHLDSTILAEQVLIQDAFSTLNKSRELLASYLKDPRPETLDSYNRTYPFLQVLLSRFSKLSRDVSENQVAIDFGNLIQTFTEEANSSINVMKDGDLGNVERNNAEALKVYKLISRLIESLFDVLVSDATQFQKNTQILRTTNILLATIFSAFVIAVFLVFMLQINHHVISPIQSLTRAAQKFKGGEVGVEFTAGTTDREIALLAAAFRSMIDTIQTQFSELKEASETLARLHDEELSNERMRALVKEAKLEALQARINPHFMFNTLNMICQMAYLENAVKTATLMEALSALLRYNLDSFGKTVSLADELKTLKDYIYIQNLRFGGRIDFPVECDGTLLGLRIPSLTLQPLVENAVLHGVKTYLKDARVAVSIAREGPVAMLEIRDNGLGMDEEKVEQLLESLNDRKSELDSERIGIYNVYARLSIIYGEQLDFSIISRKGEGTAIRISVPIEGYV